MIAVKPCPFCGHAKLKSTGLAPYLHVLPDGVETDPDGWLSVVCTGYGWYWVECDCDAAGPKVQGPKNAWTDKEKTKKAVAEAVEAWNGRIQPEEVPADAH